MKIITDAIRSLWISYATLVGVCPECRRPIERHYLNIKACRRCHPNPFESPRDQAPRKEAP